MDTELTISEDLFESLKCCLCDKYLSILPIISLTESGKPYKCGRCFDIPSEKIIRNLCYEKVAAFLTFPCSYKGCTEKITWDLVDIHEKYCQQRVIKCLINKCDALVAVCDMEKHFKSPNHIRRIYYNKIKKLTMKNQCSIVILLKTVQDNYFVVLRHSYETLYAGVYSLQSYLRRKDLDFKLTMTTNGSHSPSVSYIGKVIHYDDLEHCMNCVRKRCQLDYHKFSVKYGQSGKNINMFPLKINYEALEKILFAQSSLIFYSFDILLPDNDNNVESEKSSQSSEDIPEANVTETLHDSINDISLTE